MLDNTGMLPHAWRKFRGLMHSRRKVGHFLFLMLFPLIMAFIAGWYGLGAFKPWPNRLTAIPFWIGLLLLLWGVSFLALMLLRRKMPTSSGFSLLASGFISAIAGTFAFRPLASLYGHTYGWVMGYSRDRVVTPFPESLESLVSWHLDYIPFIFVWILSLFLFEQLSGNDRQPMAAGKEAGKDGFKALLDTIDAGDLIAVCAEGHYIRVHSVSGEFRLLYRFSSALDVLMDWHGMRIHRSYWVNIDHIRHFEADATRAHITLTRGIRLPVSMTYRDSVASSFGTASYRQWPQDPGARMIAAR